MSFPNGWKKIWCNLEKSCDILISNSLGFVSGSWILLSLIDFHLSARVDDFLVQDLSSFFEIFNWSRCVAFLRFLDFQRTLRNFVMKSWGTYSIKSFLFYLLSSFLTNSTLKAQKDEKPIHFEMLNMMVDVFDCTK